MGLWNKSPEVGPDTITQLQARLDATPGFADFVPQGGWLKHPDAKSQYARQILGSALPDGYDVDQNGRIVYTNKTPILRQLAETAGPVAGMMVAGPLLPGQAANAGAGGLAPLGGTQAAYDAGMFGAPSATAGANMAGSLAPLGGLGPTATTVASNAAPAASGIKNFLTNPANLAKLGIMIPSLVSAFGNSGGSGGMSDQEKSLLDEAVRRTQRTDPLHQAVTQLAYSRLPISARDGTALTGK